MRAARGVGRVVGVEGAIALAFLGAAWLFGLWAVLLLLLMWAAFFSLWCVARHRRRAYVVPADHDLDPGSISCAYRWVI